jgi:hypothetical protein
MQVCGMFSSPFDQLRSFNTYAQGFSYTGMHRMQASQLYYDAQQTHYDSAA